MSANDELQAHTCEKIMQEHGNVANEKVQDLTEAWENGELKWHKSYYCQNTKGDFCIATLMGADVLYSQELGASLNFGYWEVLAKVPSYEKWNAVLESNENLFKTIQVLKKRLVEVTEENAKLKELLKECRDELNEYDSYTEFNEVGRNKLLTKIDEVLK